jgi:hypothetical protein
MCVIGSTRLAENGKSADAILSKYFPGLEIRAVGPRAAAARRPLPFPGAPAPPATN